MRKFYALLAFIPAIISFGIAIHMTINKAEVPVALLSFNGKHVKDINFKEYDPATSFNVLSAIDSNDCERIEKTSTYYDDEELIEWIAFKAEICFWQRENDPLFEEKNILNIVTGLFVEEEFYKDYYDMFPEGTVFEEPKEYA